MPNWRFSGSIVSTINARAVVLANTQAKHIWDRCPFDFDTLQTFLVPDPKVWNALTVARDAGIEVPQIAVMSLIFSAKLWNEFGIQRSAILNIASPRDTGWWASRLYGNLSDNYGGTSSVSLWTRRAKGAYIRPDQIADDELRTQVVQWVNLSVRNARLRNMAIEAVSCAMDMLESSGQLLANWPFLATLCTDDFWTNRFRNPPLRLHNYRVHTFSHAVSEVTREATEVFLTGAGMLEPYAPDSSRITATLSTYNPTATTEDYAP